MKIALIGSRGIPARYSGFEQFYEQFAVRLAARGHDVTVYNRSHFIKDVKKEYNRVRIVSLPSIPTKHLDTIVHTAISTIHALFCRYDIVYYCIAGNSPLVWLPRLTGARTLLNVDGEDWAREKWKGFAKWYQLKCEWLATKTANILIADAKGVQARYRKKYQTETVFVPYGANIRKDDRTDTLKKWNVQPREYFLYVGRFVPENAIDLLIRAFKNVRTDKKLVIIGDAPYTGDYKAEIQKLAAEDSRVVLTGYAFGNDYAQLSSSAYVYVQPSGVDGTRPALLDQMGFSNCVLVRNSAVNMEVIGDCGCFFDRESMEVSLTEVMQDLTEHPDRVNSYRAKVASRIENYYNWEWVTSFYEDLFRRLVERSPTQSYDEFTAHAEHPVGI
ncbi:MAG: glycosyltransferase [Kiritimatiellales bacterium]